MILVVDDNPVQALTRKAILNRAGLEVRTAYSAEAAFDALYSQSQRASARFTSFSSGRPNYLRPRASCLASLPSLARSATIEAEQFDFL